MKSTRQATKLVTKGALILTLAGLIAKILSAVYRIPFQNIVGDRGFYVYQQVYPLYGIGMTFTLSGLPNYIGKQIAYQRQLTERRLFIWRYSVMMIYFAAFCFGICYFGASWMAQAMGDQALTTVIKRVSWMFIWMPGLMMLRGAFQAYHVMTPIALSQVIEQVVRVAVILCAAYAFVHGKSAHDLYLMGADAMQSAWIAGAVALACLCFALGRTKSIRRLFRYRPKATYIPYHLSYPYLWREFLTEGLLICGYSALLVFFQLIDSFTLYDGLRLSGMGMVEAQMLKGVYDRGQPLVQLGMVIAIAFQASYLPALASAYIRKRHTDFLLNSTRYIRITLFMSLLVTSGMIAIMPQLNHMLFGDRSGSDLLMQYMLLIVLASFVLALVNILQAQTKTLYCGLAFIAGISLKALTNQSFVLYFGAKGAVWATLVALSVMALLIWVVLLKTLRQAVQLPSLLMRLMPLCFAMPVTIQLTLAALQVYLPGGRFGAIIAIVLGIGIGIVMALGYFLLVPVLTSSEWLGLPGGRLLQRMMRNYQKEEEYEIR